MREDFEEEVIQNNIIHCRPQHHCQRGRGVTVQLTGEVAKKATNTRKFAAQNIAMYEILIQVQGQRVFHVPRKGPR